MELEKALEHIRSLKEIADLYDDSGLNIYDKHAGNILTAIAHDDLDWYKDETKDLLEELANHRHNTTFFDDRNYVLLISLIEEAKDENSDI